MRRPPSLACFAKKKKQVENFIGYVKIATIQHNVECYTIKLTALQ